jgi:hypothetical protein
MSSHNQKKANRANSRLSTGPKTLIGKERSSLNSFKHGLSSGRFLPYSRNEELYKLLILNGFEENQALQMERAFSSLQNAMATMAEAYLEVPEKDLDEIQSMYTNLLDVSAWSLLATRKIKRYVRLGKMLSEELSDPLDIGKRVKQAYPTIRYQQTAAAELSRCLKSAKTNPI